MLQITDNEKEQQIRPLFRLGFRPFFLFGTIFTVVNTLLWTLLLTGKLTLPSQFPPSIWHAHEMLFGFAGAIIIGFLLTAVQNWTGVPGVRGKQLIILFSIWLVARVALFILPPQLFWVSFIIEISWMPFAALLLARAIISVKQWRNLFFVPLLVLMSLLNAVSLIAIQQYQYIVAQQATWSMLFLVLFIIAVMGGRVIPFFTARGTNTEKVAAVKVVEYIAIAPLLLLAILMWFPEPDSIAVLAILAGVSNAIRLIRWRPMITLSVPLLWSLHLSYLMLSVGLIFYGLAFYIPSINAITMIHLTAIAGIGGIILAMISRVSLGHTGRSLTPSKWMSIAFIATVLSAIARVIFPYLMPNAPLMAYAISGLFWCCAFMLFVICYAKMLTTARVDNRPG